MKFSMILAQNNRSKAYLQNLIKNNFFPEKILVLHTNKVMPEHTINDKFKFFNQVFFRKIDSLNISYNEKEDILTTIKKYNINYEIIPAELKKSIKKIRELPTEYVIYSGLGGIILKKEIVKLKKFIHVHPGILPKFRGSTTIYYSYLIEKKFGTSVIILNENVDEGVILFQKEYIIKEKNIDFDYTLDPLIRAKTLILFLENFKLQPKKQENKDGNTFYIIHPLLKNLALYEYKNNQ